MKPEILRVVNRYARGLVLGTEQETLFKRVFEELSGFGEMTTAYPELGRGMVYGLLGPMKRFQVIEGLGKELGWHQKTIDFLRILSNHNRLGILRQIIKRGKDLWDRYDGREVIRVFSPHQLRKDQKQDLKKTLEKAADRQTVLDTKVEPALIAGLKLQKGYTVYDFSIRGNMNRLREHLIREDG